MALAVCVMGAPQSSVLHSQYPRVTLGSRSLVLVLLVYWVSSLIE